MGHTELLSSRESGRYCHINYCLSTPYSHIPLYIACHKSSYTPFLIHPPLYTFTGGSWKRSHHVSIVQGSTRGSSSNRCPRVVFVSSVPTKQHNTELMWFDSNRMPLSVLMGNDMVGLITNTTTETATATATATTSTTAVTTITSTSPSHPTVNVIPSSLSMRLPDPCVYNVPLHLGANSFFLYPLIHPSLPHNSPFNNIPR